MGRSFPDNKLAVIRRLLITWFSSLLLCNGVSANELSYKCEVIEHRCFVVEKAITCKEDGIGSTFEVNQQKMKESYPVVVDEGPTWLAVRNKKSFDIELESAVLETFKDDPTKATYQKFERYINKTGPNGQPETIITRRYFSNCSAIKNVAASSPSPSNGICDLSSNKKAGDKIDAQTQKRVDGLAKQMIGFAIAQGWEPADSTIAECSGGARLSLITKYGNSLLLNTSKGAVSWSAKDNYDSYNALCYDYQMKRAFRSNVWCDPSLKRR